MGCLFPTDMGGSVPASVSLQGGLPSCDSLPRGSKTDALAPAFKHSYHSVDPILLRTGWSALGTFPASCQGSKAEVG